jgi:7-cyano-7-deazaguanine synthase
MLVILSGGQDSTICLYWAIQHVGHKKVHAVTFDYGQRHASEINAARYIAEFAGIESHDVVTIIDVLKSTSPLVSTTPLEQYRSFTDMESIIGDRVEKTFVPMRNALFLTLAANRAVALGLDTVVTGVCQEDNANYPDCRKAFISSMETSIRLALNVDDFNIFTPVINLPKHEALRTLALTLPGCYEALAWTHTAYDGGYPPTGLDHASVLRRESFRRAGIPDPLVVRAWLDGLMSLPEDPSYDVVRDIESLHELWRKVPCEGVSF